MEQVKLTNQKETLAFLREKYPNCFFIDKQVKPLKIGIFQDLASDLEGQDIVSKRLLRMSLRHYTSSWRYLGSVKAGTPRVDLAGKDGDLVEQQHADHAAEQLKESKAKAAKMREQAEALKPAKHKGYEGKAGDKAGKATGHVKKAMNLSSKVTKPTANKTTPPKAIVLKPITNVVDTDIVVGANVLVKLGKEPMEVVITDISKDGVFVQLKSGMTVKVKQAQLYKAE
jgi:ProP effector